MITALLAYQAATSNPERDVIQASMLCMLKGEEWMISDWREAKSVVIHAKAIQVDATKGFSKAVATVLRRLRDALAKADTRDRVRDQIKQLEALSSVKDGKASGEIDLTNLSFDSRITVLDRKKWESWEDRRICSTLHRPRFP